MGHLNIGTSNNPGCIFAELFGWKQAFFNQVADHGQAYIEGIGGLAQRHFPTLGPFAITVSRDVLLMAQRANRATWPIH